YQLVRRRLPHVSLGTVYRNLQVLSASGAIRKLRLGCAQSRFDGDVTSHYHVRCVKCGRVDDVPIKPLRAIDSALHKITGYHALGYRLEFTGSCGRCSKTEPRRRKGRVDDAG
ncbi:MAG: transcriptional repressor, partial [Armatimonadota bacterium]